MTDRVEMVRAGLDDTPTISFILREAAEWLVQRGQALWEPERITPEALRPAVARGEFYLARMNGFSVGAMILQGEDQKFWPDAAPGEAAYIHKLAVRRSAAGQGVAAAMIAWAKQAATDDGRRFLRLDCPPPATASGIL